MEINSELPGSEQDDEGAIGESAGSAVEEDAGEPHHDGEI